MLSKGNYKYCTINPQGEAIGGAEGGGGVFIVTAKGRMMDADSERRVSE